MSNVAQHFRVAIVGTGFSGLGMAIRLKQSNIDDFVILERSGDIGGTWRDNTYPGCACDIPSHLYSFSFALNPNWSHTYSPQQEIWAYLRQCADNYKITPHIRWNCALQEAVWDEINREWKISTPQGLITAQVLILGNGPLSEPATPNIPGLSNFQGTIFHSAHWNHTHNLSGERVAVIGTGASAIQFVPQIQPKVGELLLFQRTPPWIVPRLDKEIPMWKRKLYRYVPLAQRLVRGRIYWQREYLALGFVRKPELVKNAEKLALKHLEAQVADPALRTKLTPHYALGCKRVLVSDDFYPAITQPNVQLITNAIKEIGTHSVITSDGEEYPVDTIICGTGFRATAVPVARLIWGRNSQNLAETWQGSAEAYRGTTVSGYPNLFFLIGPNTGLGHNSMVHMIESQISYVLDALKTMEQRQWQAIEVRPEVQENFNEELQQRMARTVWSSGCKSWYLNSQGRNTTLWPGFTFSFRRLTKHFDTAGYTTTSKKATEAAIEPTAVSQ